MFISCFIELDCRQELAQLKEENKILEEVIHKFFHRNELFFIIFRRKLIYNTNVPY